MSARWEDGRLELPDGSALDVAARGPGAEVRWHDGALELLGPPPDPGEPDHTLELLVRHGVAPVEHLWVPHLTPAPPNVAGDQVFRSPAFIAASPDLALALVPDIDDVAGADGWRAWLDYDHPRSTMTLAAGDYRQDGHVFFVRQPTTRRRGAVSLRLHVVASIAAADRRNPYGMAARWLWERWGRAGYARAPAPDWSRLIGHVTRWAFSDEGWADSVWQEVALADGTRAAAPVFIVDVTRHPSVPPAQRRWREPPSIWNQAWFSTQRCANGLLRHARHVRSADLEQRAAAMTRVALAAPQRDGLFPAVLVRDDRDGQREWRWSNSDRRPPTVSEGACHLVDAAFTCRMLLEWHTLTGEPEGLARARRFAERLAALQRPSGAFPGWVEPDGRVAPELAEGPESAVSVSLLFELGDHDRALAGVRFLEGVARDGRWEDFETYYSCAPWGAPQQMGRRVARNGVHKQNTLSLYWCAEAFLQAWRARRAPEHLALARRCVDELSLYQAVWDPPFLPAPAHGGFGVMNADSEWNDARQSLFAPLYLDLGRESGDRELVERGASALRASFSMMYCPENAALARAYERRFPFFGRESYGFTMENQGHDPSQPIGTFTIYTWGNGSALAAAATVRDRFPEIARELGLA